MINSQSLRSVMLSNIPLHLINIYNPLKLRDKMSDVMYMPLYFFYKIIEYRVGNCKVVM